MDMNQCNFTGRLGRDPEIKHTAGGTAVANISIAVSGRQKKGEQWEETTEWVPVVLFGRTAEIAGEYLTKGSQVRISGRFQTRSWEKDGETRHRSEIVANELQMLGGKADRQGKAETKPSKPAAAQADDEFSDDIPF